ncbi:MAG UNVERIFIED_CONTAM: hypothetical protein LVR29_02120 [Microcystis novacekii LVE1205-3]
MPVNTFESQNRATRGKAGAKMKEDDGIDHFITCRDHDSVLFFTDLRVAIVSTPIISPPVPVPLAGFPSCNC